jgi:two-component system cell cycle response regulator
MSYTDGPSASGKSGAIKVLLIEDNPVEGHLIKASLMHAAGQNLHLGVFEIVSARTLTAALDSIARESADVVLLDLSLPDSHGLETFRKFRENSPTVPIVVLTGRDDDSLALEAMACGAQDYLVKGRTAGQEVARAVRYAVERHRLQTSLSLVDEMTGLYNRRGFITLAQQHLRTAWRRQDDSILIYADMDGLKQINDQQGHREGSNALILVAESLKNTFRESDIVGRVGGDEFAVIVTDASDSEIRTIEARLVQNLEKTGADHALQYELGLSIGVAHICGRQQTSLEDLMAQADEAMYKQKQLRRESRGRIPVRPSAS